MSGAADPRPDQLLDLARDGDHELRGRLMEVYRNYLKMLAQLQIDRRLQGKADASDVVQETFLQAHGAFEGFRGTSEAELLQWLREILSSKLANLVRHFYKTQRRDVRLEQQLDEEMDRSSKIASALVQSQSSPSEKAVRRERAVLLADALEQLPAHYQRVIVLHHLEELSFREVAQRMERSIDGVKNIWVRALATLHRSLGGRLDGPI